MKPSEAQEQLLCCALADDAAWQAADLARWWQATGEEQAWDFCGRSEACSIVAVALGRVLGAGAVPARWRAEREQTERRLHLYLEQLDRVAAALARENIRLVALKNSGIARGIYPPLGASPMGDIDVLVDPREFRRAHACMLALGFALNSRSPLGEKNLEEAEQSGGSEYTLPLADGSVLWFELQWRPVAGRWIQPDQEPAAAGLLARSVAIAGTSARLLCPVDNLLQVCLHTAKHSYVRAPGFRLHTDVDRIVRRCAIDWEEFVQLAGQLRVRTAVFFSLEIPSSRLRTPVPEWVLDRLRPPAWREKAIRRSLARAGLFDADRQKWSKAGYIFFNVLLYDSSAGILRAVFPTAEWMRKRYDFRRAYMLPWWYAVRIAGLIFKRANT